MSYLLKLICFTLVSSTFALHVYSLQSMTMLLHLQRTILALYCFNTVKLEGSQGM